jgi:hypothetical protein
VTNGHEDKSIPSFDTQEGWARYLSNTGFPVMPRPAGTTKPPEHWAQWLTDQSDERIALYWGANTTVEAGVFGGLEFYALRARRPEAARELLQLEEKHAVHPAVVVHSDEGYDHYFRLALGTIAKHELHDCEQHPERLDVVTGPNLLSGPGGRGKQILKWDIEHFDDLTLATQGFVHDVARLNGRQLPSEFSGHVEADGAESTRNGSQSLMAHTQQGSEELDLAALRMVYGTSYRTVSTLSNWSAPTHFEAATHTKGSCVPGQTRWAPRITDRRAFWRADSEILAHA